MRALLPPGLPAAALLAALLAAGCARAGAPARAERGTIGRVTDGDTVRLTDGRRVRLVQIDTPEVAFRPECYGVEASRATERLIPPGTRVRLEREPKTDDVDGYGRLLRYVVRERDGLEVNLALVAAGDAAPYFYRRRRGRYANELETSARRAEAARRGLWGRCPATRLDPDRGVSTGLR